MPGDSGVLIVTRVRSITTIAHEAAGAAGTRHSPRPPRGRKINANLGRFALRDREAMSGVATSLRAKRSDPDAVIPGWSAGPDLRCAIAHRGISRFRVRCSASPRNDGVWICFAKLLFADPLAFAMTVTTRIHSSCPDLIRASIHLRKKLLRRWITGSSPVMTISRRSRRTRTSPPRFVFALQPA
jgi:hypothetical protein